MSDITVQAWPAPRTGVRPLLMAALCAAGVIAAAIGRLGTWQSEPAVPTAPGAAASPEAPPPQWLEIRKPVQIFSLETPSFPQDGLRYSARRLVSGTAREDTLAYAAPAEAAPMLRLALLRGDGVATTGLDAGLSRLAARQDLSATLGRRRGALTTRFGRFETATLRIAGRGATCDAFHLALGEPTLAVDGIACGIARRDLACLIDRLDLASAGEDSALADLFAAAELRRNPTCSGTRLAPDAAHAAWLDDKRATPHGKMRRRTGF